MRKTEKFIFAWADVFGGGGQAIISVMYMIFLTDVLGVDPGFAGTAILISKLWDGINDPLMGAISDNTRTRFGRRKPFLFIGSLLIVIAIALLWAPVTHFSQTTKNIYVVATYLFYNTIQTMIAVPYSSLSTEITTDYDERNSVNILRLVFSTVATAVCTLVPSYLFNAYADGSISLQTFYLTILIGSSIFFAVPIFLASIVTKERTPIPTERARFSFGQFAEPLKNNPFRHLMGMYLCQSISMDIMSTLILYYALYVVMGVNATIFLGIFIGIQLLMFPTIQYFVKRISKNRIYYFGLPLSIIAVIGIGLYPTNWPVWGVYGLTVLLALGFAGAQLTSWIMFPDVVDSAEFLTGKRQAGSYSGLMTFIRHISSAVVIQVFGLVLSLAGYVGQADTQSTGVVWGIRLTLLFGFTLLMSIAYIVAKKYPLTHEISLKINAYLKSLRSGATLSVEEQADIQSLRKELT